MIIAHMFYLSSRDHGEMTGNANDRKDNLRAFGLRSSQGMRVQLTQEV